MIEKIAEIFSRQCVQTGLYRQDEYEALVYGYKKILNYLVQTVILLGIALLFGMMLPMLSFLLEYCILRPKVGGAHAKTHIGCVVSLTAIAIAVCVVSRLLSLTLVWPACVPTVFILLVSVYVCAPITHPNAPKKERTLARCKRQGRQSATVQAAVILAASICCPEWLLPAVTSAALGGLVIVAVLITPHVKNKRKGGKRDEGER